MVFISFNINGLRTAIRDGFIDFLHKSAADFILLQETKLNSSIDFGDFGYQSVWNFSKRKGYSGTAILFKKNPLNVQCGFGEDSEIDNDEGRIITLEYQSFFVVNIYFPNFQGGLDRWYYRLDWFSALKEYLSVLCDKKAVIIGGDFNLAHTHLDVYPKDKEDLKEKFGFTEEERAEFDHLLELGFVDTFRTCYPEERSYTWWSKSHENYKHNRGRRIDYFLTSKNWFQKFAKAP